jgi:hypothetical protein
MKIIHWCCLSPYVRFHWCSTRRYRTVHTSWYLISRISLSPPPWPLARHQLGDARAGVWLQSYSGSTPRDVQGRSIQRASLEPPCVHRAEPVWPERRSFILGREVAADRGSIRVSTVPVPTGTMTCSAVLTVQYDRAAPSRIQSGSQDVC